MKDFVIRQCANGNGVFASRPFAPGELITEFTGPIFHESEIAEAYEKWGDHFFQIDKDTYMGPSGGIDDIINHSCDPNCGHRFINGRVFLHAIRPIALGEELSWDYSTTLYRSDYQMQCNCGSAVCRGVVGNFSDMNVRTKQLYIELGIVPPYVVEEELVPVGGARFGPASRLKKPPPRRRQQ